jgi:hypothetical protein
LTRQLLANAGGRRLGWRKVLRTEKPRPSLRPGLSLSTQGEKTRPRWMQSRVSRRFITGRWLPLMVRTHVLRTHGPHLQPPSKELSTKMAVPRSKPRQGLRFYGREAQPHARTAGPCYP